MFHFKAVYSYYLSKNEGKSRPWDFFVEAKVTMHLWPSLIQLELVNNSSFIGVLRFQSRNVSLTKGPLTVQDRTPWSFHALCCGDTSD